MKRATHVKTEYFCVAYILFLMILRISSLINPCQSILIQKCLPLRCLHLCRLLSLQRYSDYVFRSRLTNCS